MNVVNERGTMNKLEKEVSLNDETQLIMKYNVIKQCPLLASFLLLLFK
jgi:hypothetical protein